MKRLILLGILNFIPVSAFAQIQSQEIQDDFKAQNLAYKAAGGDQNSEYELKTKSKTNPAYEYGLYKLKLLEWQNEHSGSSLPLPSPLVDDLTASILINYAPDSYAQLEKIQVAQNQQPDTIKYRQMLEPLIAAAVQNDPAADAALSNEYWSEVSREMALWDYIATHSDPFGTASDYENQDGGAEFEALKLSCARGLQLGLKSHSAGWPNAYDALVMYVLMPDSSSPGWQVSQDAGCSGQIVLGFQGMNGANALLKQGAEAGAVKDIEGEILNTKDDPTDQKKWIQNLTKLADAGNLEAAVEKKNLENYGVIQEPQN